MTVETKELTDVEFLEKIIAELDHGWTTGNLCDRSGKKCLVGAAITVLGFDWSPVLRGGGLYDDFDADLTPEELDNWFTQSKIFHESYRGLTDKAVDRLYLIFHEEIADFEVERHLTERDEGTFWRVTRFNDVREDYLTELRPILTEKLEALKEAS